jgi:alkylation response protein AidB-like acyl-CoA dehydrogenase
VTFVLSDEQRDFQLAVRRFLDDASSEAKVRETMERPTGFDPSVWHKMAAEIGLQGIAIPEKYGGQGFGAVVQGVALEEMGRSLLCAPYLSTAVLAVSALLYARDEEARKSLLPGIASGEFVATLAVSDQAGRWDPSAVATRATSTRGGWKLEGTALFVLDGHLADVVLVAARTPVGLSLFHTRGDAPGLARTPLATLDRTRKQAKLEFAGVEATLIGEEGSAAPVLERVLHAAAAALAAEQVGGAQRCLDMAVDYAKVRVQFERPIGSFQAIKHKCADMLLDVEAARSAALYASTCVDEQHEDLACAASTAKAFCSEAYVRCAAANIQIHGGIGITWEHPAHLFLRRAKTSEILFGTPTEHRERLVQQIAAARSGAGEL